ncbi:MAG: hypothetical protein ACJ71M_10665 [Nitrososphaeraceae archaeon]
MNDLGTRASGGYYYNESKRIFGSFDPKYYDQIITKLNLHSREEYERSMQHLLQNQKIQLEALHNQTRRTKKRILLVDDEPDLCMVYQIVLQELAMNASPIQTQLKLCKNTDLSIMI